MENFCNTPTEDHLVNKPRPCDFDLYLPWACDQLQVACDVLVTKLVQSEYVSAIAATDRKAKGKNKMKVAPSRIDIGSDTKNYDEIISLSRLLPVSQNVVKIYAIYNNFDKLIHIKFDKNIKIPQKLLKILQLIIPFQTALHSLTINRGLDQNSIHEIRKLLSLSHITDVCLDNTYLKEANYYILLENENPIRNLSLCRCSINDDVIERIAANLAFPLPSSKTLSTLNLSTNRITDLGASYIAAALRSNRQLIYLNLADNTITDNGMESLLDSLKEYSLSAEEQLNTKGRLMKYLKDKNALVNRLFKDLRDTDFERRSGKRKSLRPFTAAQKPKKGIEKDTSLKSMPESKSLANLDSILLEKATLMAENMLGDFNDPFSNDNVFTKEGVVYCFGNNTLSYLNISYNNLTYVSVKKLLSILQTQSKNDRKPKGLINIWIDGNNLPISCKELVQIDQILESGLMIHDKGSLGKKRTASRSVTR